VNRFVIARCLSADDHCAIIVRRGERFIIRAA
jgi:hypothetical protein